MAAPRPTLPSIAVLAALASPTLATACGNEPDRGPPPRLVEPSAERLAALTASGPAAEVLPARGLTTAAELEAYVEECAEAEAARAKNPDPDAASSAKIGVVYRGDKPKKLPPIQDDKIFRWTEGNPEYIDPNKIAEAAGTSIVSNLFEPLLVRAAGNAPPVPAAATRYDVSADGRVYTFHLRPGMVWSDGRPVTAHDYVYGFLRGLAPETGSRNAQQLWVIEGAKDYNAGRIKSADQVGVRALDDLTLEIRLVGPAPYFPDLVTYIAYSPIPRWAVEAHGDQWVRPEHIVTNGPFRLSRWLERDRFELVKNPTFWGAADVALEGSVIYITDNEAQVLTLYESGQTHLARPLSPDSLQRAVKEGRADLRIDTNACVYYYALRLDHGPLSDSRVRLALNLAFDKETLVTHVLGAFQLPAQSFVPPMFEAFMGYRSPSLPERDPLMASRLLAAAGYPRGKGFPTLDILYNTSEGHKRIAEFAARSWQETLGIAMSASNMEWKSLLKQTRTGDFSLARSAWCADYPDPLNFLELFYSASENNITGYDNPAFDAILNRSRNEPDRARRRALLCAAEKALLTDLPFVPLYQYTRSILLRPEIKGYESQYQDHHPLRWVSIENTPAPGGDR